MPLPSDLSGRNSATTVSNVTVLEHVRLRLSSIGGKVEAPQRRRKLDAEDELDLREFECRNARRWIEKSHVDRPSVSSPSEDGLPRPAMTSWNSCPEHDSTSTIIPAKGRRRDSLAFSAAIFVEARTQALRRPRAWAARFRCTLRTTGRITCGAAAGTSRTPACRAIQCARAA